MRWRVLGAVLAVILLAALIFSMWPSTPSNDPLPPVEPAARTLPPPPTPAAVAPPPQPSKAPPMPATAPPPPTAGAAPAPPNLPEGVGELDPEPDPGHLEQLGLTDADLEPLDGGVLHPLTRDGIKGAVQEALPEIKECYEDWLQQNPELGGKVKVSFTISEIPGRNRGKVMRVDTLDGGTGHIAFEGCVRNVFKGLRFEAPEGGEMKVTYPLTFSTAPRGP